MMKAITDKIKFSFNRQKAIETILYFSNARQNLSVMHLLKFLYYADLYHLNRYDRPIIGDTYFAMKNGPVASNVYNMLKKSCIDYTLIPKDKIKVIKAERQADLDYFSDTDLEAFNYVLETYKNMNAEQMSEETHKTKAWQNAWNKKPFYAERAEIVYEDFFEDIPPKKLEFLKENAALMVF